eukprot:TRINITY_DN1554_c0_g1_i5.p1 TRINITY_DN1554_c0_g1~~TRINITY_DN1554_c0_g1_i5.p1  ORF type:complete len:157 (-),score=42.26 TRINITY_DN1554_c0_g1_i5:3-473(-)
MEDIEKQKVDTLGTQDEVQVLRRASTSSNLGLDFFIKVRDIPGALESLNEGIEELESLRERMEKTTVEDQEDKLIQMTTKKLNGLAKQAQDGREMLSEVTRELIRAKEEGDESEVAQETHAQTQEKAQKNESEIQVNGLIAREQGDLKSSLLVMNF